MVASSFAENRSVPARLVPRSLGVLSCEFKPTKKGDPGTTDRSPFGATLYEETIPFCPKLGLVANRKRPSGLSRITCDKRNPLRGIEGSGSLVRVPLFATLKMPSRGSWGMTPPTNSRLLAQLISNEKGVASSSGRPSGEPGASMSPPSDAIWYVHSASKPDTTRNRPLGVTFKNVGRKTDFGGPGSGVRAPSEPIANPVTLP